jgi:hypothetical protein
MWLECATFSGSGDIRADGGQGGNGGRGCSAGGGGGGRIALHYTTATFSGDITVRGGLGGHERGDGGTIYNGGSAWFPTVGGDHGGADWTLSSARNIGGVHYGIGTFSIGGGVTATLVRHSALVVTAAQATVTGDINGDGAGGGRSAGAGLGDGCEFSSGSAGGGYGGAGGNGEPGEGSAIGGAAWTDGDDEHYPDEFGSDSGGGASGGSGGGGGAVKLDIAGTLNLGGTISVNGITGGNAAGGGAGGSIWLDCGALAGTGTLSARGGDGYSGSDDGGGGGGGRIAVYYTTGEFGFSTNVLGGAAGGVTASAGLVGTVYLHGPPKGTLFMFR